MAAKSSAREKPQKNKNNHVKLFFADRGINLEINRSKQKCRRRDGDRPAVRRKAGPYARLNAETESVIDEKFPAKISAQQPGGQAVAAVLRFVDIRGCGHSPKRRNARHLGINARGQAGVDAEIDIFSMRCAQERSQNKALAEPNWNDDQGLSTLKSGAQTPFAIGLVFLRMCRVRPSCRQQQRQYATPRARMTIAHSFCVLSVL